MIVDHVLLDVEETVRSLINVVSNNLSAADNFAPDGTVGTVLASNGSDRPPSFQSLESLIEDIDITDDHTHVVTAEEIQGRMSKGQLPDHIAYENEANVFTEINTFNTEIITAPSTVDLAGLNVPHGVAPTAPVNGDIWTTTAGLYGQINSVTQGPYAHTLNSVLNPDGDKTFSMTTRQLKFLWTAPTGNPLELEASGAYTGALLHIHQHTGNPGSAYLVELEATDTDIEHIKTVGALVTTHTLCAYVTGDTTERLAIHSDGKLEWGSGSAAADANLYRSAANVLKTDDSLFVEGTTFILGSSTAGGQRTLYIQSYTSDAYLIIESGHDAGAEESMIYFNHGAAAYWETGKASDHSYRIRDVVGTQNVISIVSSGDMTLNPAGNVNLASGVVLEANGTQVVTVRQTGWTASTGTAARGAYATFSGQTITNPPTQTEVQNIDDHVVILSQQLKAMKDDLITHGLIGT